MGRPESGGGTIKKIASIKQWVDAYVKIENDLDDLHLIFDFVKDGEATEQEVDEQYNQVKALIEDLEMRNMLA